MKSSQCKWCGNLFESADTGREAKFCTSGCRVKAHRAGSAVPSFCAVCGTQITPRKQYCTEICRVKAQLERLNKLKTTETQP